MPEPHREVRAAIRLAAGILDEIWIHLLRQPAAWSVPLAFLVMIFVSRSTKRSVPANVERVMALLHVPDWRAKF